ncbi:MAG: hypothetical protein ABIS36_16220 [Chryseolinea sp.]
MKITKVEYTVRPGFAKQNAENIAVVINQLKAIGDVNLKYSSYMKDDGKSFVHFVMINSEGAAKILSGLESFKKFQAELKASNTEIPPRVESLSLVHSSFDLF